MKYSIALPEQPQPIDDLLDVNNEITSLNIHSSVKHIENVKDLHIDNLWLGGAKEIHLKKTLPLVNLKFLKLFQVFAKELSSLETQTEVSTIILVSSTKTTQLWDMRKNNNLKTLELTDFSKLEDIDQLATAKQIEHLILGGGVWNPLKIKTLKPLSSLVNLKYLSLSNIKVADDSLKPLADLKNLKELDITNQFDVKEFAWLASRLPNTKCEMFQATNSVRIPDEEGNIVADIMVTGRRKPFLLSVKDQEKINKYTLEFERLKKELA